MTMPIKRVWDAAPAERARLKAAYLGWLQDPGNDGLQITGRIFAPGGPAAGCCAVGGLLQVLADHGYARLDGDEVVVRMDVPGFGIIDAPLGPEGRFLDTGSVPEEIALALDLGLDDIPGLNDGPCALFAFWEIAQVIEERGATILSPRRPDLNVTAQRLTEEVRHRNE